MFYFVQEKSITLWPNRLSRPNYLGHTDRRLQYRKEEFDPSHRFILLFISLALEFQIIRVAVKDVDLRRWDVEVIEQVHALVKKY